MKLNQRRRDNILEYVSGYWEKRNYSPTRREIVVALPDYRGEMATGITLVSRYLNILEKDKLITLKRGHRNIKLTKKGRMRLLEERFQTPREKLEEKEIKYTGSMMMDNIKEENK